MSKKIRFISQLFILLFSLIVSVVFYESIAFWSALTVSGLIIISATSSLLHDFIEVEHSFLISFFTGIVFRLFFFLILVLFFNTLRNVTEVWFVAAIFPVYFLDILFEIKYIIHNLRAN